MTSRSNTLRETRTVNQTAETFLPAQAQEVKESPKHDPVRLLLYAALFLALVGGLLLVRWRMGQTAKLPDTYMAYTEDDDPYKDNESVKEARRLYRESNREDACTDFVVVERSYGWAIYCEGEKPAWLTEHAE